MLLLIAGVVGAISVISMAAKAISEFLCDGIEEREVQKRVIIREISNQLIKESEYDRRGLMLDLLTKAIKESWEEVEVLRENRTKLKAQLTLSYKYKKVASDFKARHKNMDFIQSLKYSIILNDIREYYWHRIIQKYSKKKHELVTSPLETKKLLRKRLFEPPDFDNFLQCIPIKGQLIEAKLVGRLQKGLKLEFFDGFSSLIPNEHKSFYKGWRTKSKKLVYSRNVDYYNKIVEVDSVLTFLASQIKEVGYDNFTFQASYKKDVIKEGKIVGLILDYCGTDLFLPNSLIQNQVAIKEGKAFVKFVNKNIDQNNLVVKQV